MKRNTISLPLMLSFNELAWIAAFALLILYAAAQTEKGQRELPSAKVAEAISPPSAASHEALIHRDLLGLKGEMSNVAILVDASASMRAHWPKVQRVVGTWLENLPIRKCVLIVFADGVRRFPATGLADAQGDTGTASRSLLQHELMQISPRGNTNTLLALTTAYNSPDIDTILLFTDGFPDTGNHRFDRSFVGKIYKLVEQHRSTVINTIGLGYYFDQRLGQFLFKLPEETGGSFLGL